jgi:hypothetical protein
MEIFIIGLILVALMVWASTKIKRSAAQAFDAEEVHGDGFMLNKPEGFLNRVYEKNDMLFDAYSKDFGTEADENIRAATAVVYATDEPITEAASLEQSRLIKSDRSEMFELGGSHCIIVTGTSERDGRTFNVSEKLLSQGARTLVLKIEALSEHNAELARKIELMIVSFSPR